MTANVMSRALSRGDWRAVNSPGTIFNEPPDFFRLCVEAFRDTSDRVVMAIGYKIKAESFVARNV